MNIPPNQRFSKERPCPICEGFDSVARGQGERCFGFLSNDGNWAHCTREENAGSLQINPESQTYAHLLQGDCKCGRRHGNDGNQTVKPREVAAYDYRDESGNLLFQVVRFSPKTFRQRKPDGKGAWIWNIEGSRRVLYRLPELISSDSSFHVFVPEGEKDVDNVRALGEGFQATTNPGGAGKWRDEYSESLKDRTVILLPHNDKAGRDHAFSVGVSLLKVGACIKAILLPNLPEKGDVSDWINAGGTADQLWKLVAEAPDITSEEKLSAAIGIEVPAEKKLPFKTAREIANSTPQEPPWIVKPWVAAGSVTELVGKAKLAGKTTFLSHLVKSVLDDLPFLEGKA